MAGYSGTPLIKKLGIKDGFRVEFVNPPEHYQELLGDFPGHVQLLEMGDDLNLVHIFTNNFAELEELLTLYRKRIVHNGMIWISWYKKASKLPTELNEDIIRGTALSLGMVDVKVCAVDDNWSGLKVMIRKENR